MVTIESMYSSKLSFIRFYKSKIKIRNAITKQTEDSLAAEASKYKKLIEDDVRKQQEALIMKLSNEI